MEKSIVACAIVVGISLVSAGAKAQTFNPAFAPVSLAAAHPAALAAAASILANNAVRMPGHLIRQASMVPYVTPLNTGVTAPGGLLNTNRFGKVTVASPSGIGATDMLRGVGTLASKRGLYTASPFLGTVGVPGPGSLLPPPLPSPFSAVE